MAAAQERLSAAQRSKIRRLTNPKELGPDEEEGGELNIVPFLDIVQVTETVRGPIERFDPDDGP